MAFPFDPIVVNNIATRSDAYKSGSHHKMYVPNAEDCVDYSEMRLGGKHPETVFLGAQPIMMKYLAGEVITHKQLDVARRVVGSNTGPGSFNEEGWRQIVDECDGRLPLEIAAQPEGSVLPESTVLYTIRPTAPDYVWLVGHIEPLILKTWYPSTIATNGRAIRKMINRYYRKTMGSTAGAEYALHDFGYRSVSSEESAEIGGLAHLVHFAGTDTVPALLEGVNYYGADLATLGHSVPASEHSVMTQLGREGEAEIVRQLIETFPTGVLSCVADSYDIYNFVSNIVGRIHRDAILARTDGPFVVRPDSPTPTHPVTADQVVWIYEELWKLFPEGRTINDLGYRVLDPHVGVLWGDGIGDEGIEEIYVALEAAGFATTIVVGQGGKRLQLPQRDDQRWALKQSAQKRDGIWYDIQKQPLDKSKWSKTGTFEDLNLPVVFRNGEILRYYTFNEVRERANEGL